MPVSFGVKGALAKKKGSSKQKKNIAASFLRAVKEQDAVDEAEQGAAIAAATRLQDEGTTLAEAGNLDAALRKWDAALALAPSQHSTHELRAQALLALEKYWPAIQSAEQAVSLCPSFGPGWLTLGRAQLNFGEFAKAAESFSKLEEVDAGLASEPEVVEDRARVSNLLAQHQTLVSVLYSEPCLEDLSQTISVTLVPLHCAQERTRAERSHQHKPKPTVGSPVSQIK